ncbi:unnamed protein product [Parajaminaea phylloscopi]
MASPAAVRSTLGVASRATLRASSSGSSHPASSALRRSAFSTSAHTPPRARHATWMFAGAAAALVGGLSAGKVLAESRDSLAAKRATYGDRLRANKGGNLSFQRSAEEAEEAAESDPDSLATDDGVDTIAAVVAEDASTTDDQQSAYDPSTGQINWDCPCLGGMAHGPCGNEFKEAFSCFVYSEGEPKGIECVDRFKLMQDCFRRHPEVYKEELEQEQRDELESLVFEAESALGVQQTITEEASIAQAQ